MRVWKIVIRPDPEARDLAQGYAWARTAQEARNLVDEPDVLVFEKHPDMMWPGSPAKRLIWPSRPLPEGLHEVSREKP
jgi:hypothetical protein